MFVIACFNSNFAYLDHILWVKFCTFQSLYHPLIHWNQYPHLEVLTEFGKLAGMSKKKVICLIFLPVMSRVILADCIVDRTQNMPTSSPEERDKTLIQAATFQVDICRLWDKYALCLHFCLSCKPDLFYVTKLTNLNQVLLLWQKLRKIDRWNCSLMLHNVTSHRG